MARDDVRLREGESGSAAEGPGTALSTEDAAFVGWLERSYRPEPPTPAQTAAFNARLYARLERPRHLRWLPTGWSLAPIGLISAAAAAAVLAFVGIGGDLSGGVGSDVPTEADLRVAEVLIEVSGVPADATDATFDELPSDYALLASLLSDEDDDLFGEGDDPSSGLAPQSERMGAPTARQWQG